MSFKQPALPTSSFHLHTQIFMPAFRMGLCPWMSHAPVWSPATFSGCYCTGFYPLRLPFSLLCYYLALTIPRSLSLLSVSLTPSMFLLHLCHFFRTLLGNLVPSLSIRDLWYTKQSPGRKQHAPMWNPELLKVQSQMRRMSCHREWGEVAQGSFGVNYGRVCPLRMWATLQLHSAPQVENTSHRLLLKIQLSCLGENIYLLRDVSEVLLGCLTWLKHSYLFYFNLL